MTEELLAAIAAYRDLAQREQAAKDLRDEAWAACEVANHTYAKACEHYENLHRLRWKTSRDLDKIITK